MCNRYEALNKIASFKMITMCSITLKITGSYVQVNFWSISHLKIKQIVKCTNVPIPTSSEQLPVSETQQHQQE